MDSVSCKGVDPWGGLYEHLQSGNPGGTQGLWVQDQVCMGGKVPETVIMLMITTVSYCIIYRMHWLRI